MRRLLSIGLGLWVVLAVSLFVQGEEWTKTFPISGRPELRVNASDAEIRVDAWDQKSIEARVTSEKWGFGQGGIQVTDHQTGDTVDLEVRFPHGLHVFSVGSRKTIVEIHMPREGKVRLHTGDGAILLRDVKGELEVESGDGRIDVEGADGALRAHSGDGHVRVHGRFDSLDVSTSDGRIDAEAVAGSTIGKGWSVKTGDGGVSLSVPEGFAADVALHTGDGHISLDMPVTVEGRYDHSNIHGKLNGGGLLDIHTGDGSIRLGKS
jgi:hypothetical protein